MPTPLVPGGTVGNIDRLEGNQPMEEARSARPVATLRSRHVVRAMAIVVSLAVDVLAATKTVDVGPNGSLRFVDEESGTSTTTINAGDTVEWVWMSSGHSTTRDESPKTWDSQIQGTGFTFSQTFPNPGSFPYHCTPHQILGMVGTVVVQGAGGTMTTTTTTMTTATTMPVPQGCTDAAAVAATRAQVAATCDCSTAASHGAYVRCATHVIKAAVKAGSLAKACRASVRGCAAKSTCGKAGFVTCCRTTATGRQTCSIKRTGSACKAPKGGSACVGDQPSCCDACGGAACPSGTATSTAP